MNTLKTLFKRKPFLAWDIRDINTLSEKSMLEHILNYGDWSDVLEAEQALGISKMKILFEKIKRNNRVNLKPRTINYFEKYFAKHA